MLFAHMFSCIPRRKSTARSQPSKRARKCSSSNSQRSLRRKLSKPISSILNILKRKNKLNKNCSKSMPADNDGSSRPDPLPSNDHPQPSCSGVEEGAFQHTIIYVAPVEERDITLKLPPVTTQVDVSRSVAKRSANITRASAVRRECTSLPSLLPYRNPLPSSLRRSPSVSTQRCYSAQSHVVPPSAKADVCNTTPLLGLSPPKTNESISISSSLASFTSLSQSSSTSSLDEIDHQNFTVATCPPSRHGIAYELVFKTPSVHCSLTPEPQLGPNYTYSFPRATAEASKEDNDDNWDSGDEFGDCSDSDESEGEEETDTAPPAPKCKYGVFFTAAKPPLPPSALERIRRCRNYQL